MFYLATLAGGDLKGIQSNLDTEICPAEQQIWCLPHTSLNIPIQKATDHLGTEYAWSVFCVQMQNLKKKNEKEGLSI